MKQETLINHCLFCEDTVLTYPFKDEKYGKLPVIRHKSNDKWFALIFEQDKKLYMNLKCNPLDAVLLREQHPFVQPAWHMNKTHWNKVEVEKCPLDLLKRMITESFELTKK